MRASRQPAPRAFRGWRQLQMTRHRVCVPPPLSSSASEGWQVLAPIEAKGTTLDFKEGQQLIREIVDRTRIGFLSEYPYRFTVRK